MISEVCKTSQSIKRFTDSVKSRASAVVSFLTQERGFKIGHYEEEKNGSSSRTLYVEGSSPNLKGGLNLFSVEAGMAETRQRGKLDLPLFESYETNFSTMTTDAALGVSKGYTGFQVGARQFSTGIEGRTKITVPFLNKNIVLGLQGDLLGVGARGKFEDGKFSIGYTN
ncbi:hypothetical protein V6615_13445 [Oscillospiraceae bacterium PP1C4]